jgi:hypothetical protein
VGETYATLAPRLARSCLACHATSAAGRPALATYDQVRAHAADALAQVEAGAMPPGGVDRSGACNRFLGPAPFTEGDRAALQRFIKEGLRAGPLVPPPPVTDAPLPSAGRRLEVELPLVTVATGGDDPHRCFLVDAPAGFLTGVGLESDAPIHHAMAFTVPEASVAAARALDGQDGAPGWDCPSMPQVDGVRLALAWVPGRPEVGFPPGVGVAVDGAHLIVQLHQHGAIAAPSQARLALLFDDAVDRAAEVVPIAAADFELPPGLPSVAVDRHIPLPLDGARVLGVMPHLHRAGRAVRLDAAFGPCLVDAPRFSATFQEVAFYETPMDLAPGTRLDLHCAWDTGDRLEATSFGESDDEEMCTVFLFVVAPD